PRLPPPARRSRPHHRDDHPRHAGGGAARRSRRGDAEGARHRRRFAACAHDRGARRLCRRTDGDAAPAGRAARRADESRGAGMNAFAGPVADAFRLLPDYLGSHVLVSVTALALGLLVSLPLAIISAHRPALRGVLLAVASLVQTVPGLALLALFYPLL